MQENHCQCFEAFDQYIECYNYNQEYESSSIRIHRQKHQIILINFMKIFVGIFQYFRVYSKRCRWFIVIFLFYIVFFLLIKIIFLFIIIKMFFLGTFFHFCLSYMFVFVSLLTRTIDVIEMYCWTNQMQTAYSSISTENNTYVLLQLSLFQINTSLFLQQPHSLRNYTLNKHEDIRYSSPHRYYSFYIFFRR